MILSRRLAVIIGIFWWEKEFASAADPVPLGTWTNQAKTEQDANPWMDRVRHEASVFYRGKSTVYHMSVYRSQHASPEFFDGWFLFLFFEFFNAARDAVSRCKRLQTCYER
jgi:hypothetical protein